MSDRMHNRRAFELTLNRFKVEGTNLDFIDDDMEKMLDEISQVHKQHEKKHNELLEEQKKAREDGS